MLVATPAASALEITFYPAGRAYAFEAEPQRGAHTLVIHNIGIRNETAAPVTLDAVTIDLMAGTRAVDTRTLAAEDLSRTAATGAQLQQAGLYDVLAFQFGGARLLPAGVKLSDDLVLAPGEAIILTTQIFAYRGARDAVRVRVNGAEARLPIRTDASKTVYALPLQGAWYNAAGSTFHSHHRWTPMEEFAFDFLRLGPDFKTHRGGGQRFTDYYAYGAPVFAAADGRVSSVISDQAEDAAAMRRADETIEAYFTRLQQDQMRRLAQGRAGVTGNSVVIEHGDGEYSFYAHLKPGSVAVRAGDVVKRGQQIGAVGSSGNSTEPHLHFHVCDGPDPLMCAGIPVQFEPQESIVGDLPRAPQTGDFLTGVRRRP